MTKKQRDIQDRAKYDGLVLSEVNALITATRYRGGQQRKTVQKHLSKLIAGGYWNPNLSAPNGEQGYATEKGLAVVRIVYGEMLKPFLGENET